MDPPTGAYYIHCSIVAIRCKFSIQKLKADSLASIAREIHLTTTQHKSRESARQNLSLSENNLCKALAFWPRAGANMALALLSQWTTFDFAGLDFSGACRDGLRPEVVFVDSLAIVGKDGSGDYLVRALNNLAGWKSFDDSNSMKSLFPVS